MKLTPQTPPADATHDLPNLQRIHGVSEPVALPLHLRNDWPTHAQELCEALIRSANLTRRQSHVIRFYPTEPRLPGMGRVYAQIGQRRYVLYLGQVRWHDLHTSSPPPPGEADFAAWECLRRQTRNEAVLTPEASYALVKAKWTGRLLSFEHAKTFQRLSTAAVLTLALIFVISTQLKWAAGLPPTIALGITLVLGLGVYVPLMLKLLGKLVNTLREEAAARQLTQRRLQSLEAELEKHELLEDEPVPAALLALESGGLSPALKLQIEHTQQQLLAQHEEARRQNDMRRVFETRQALDEHLDQTVASYLAQSAGARVEDELSAALDDLCRATSGSGPEDTATYDWQVRRRYLKTRADDLNPEASAWPVGDLPSKPKSRA